ncbi:hypothetical protein PLICRDRAFT_370584 [Plicaturopsis crispa FD-325 SS-3]|uniref:Endopeptidase S2P n=1 Tax=Plicaturopsis crispa FD-325 SS-3 TaxID=944288 RepID=A0A0C9SX33_PLICR|nr:hypothetical protein PLICRDRAFT_370584 [Plicaturopsis crispa FD-325 SS-3]
MHVELGQSRSPPSLNLSSRPASSTVSAVKSFTDAAYTNARVAAAGPFHNVILLLFAVSAAAAVRSTGLVAGRRMDHGLLVTALDPDSPLSAYLSIGDVLTGVDDVDLAYMPRMGTADEFEEAEDRWTAYLTGFPPSMSPLGWCARVNSDEGMGRITACCPPIADTDPNISCFNELSPSRSMHCFDPLTLLTQTKVQRCDAPVACKDGVAEAAATYLSGEWACVRPHADEHLLRIYVSNGQTISIGQDRGIRVVLWRGPGIEVFEQVQVSRYAPPWLLEILPSSIVLFLTYIPSVTLSLFFFNLLPLTPLDGGALLRALLDWFFPPDPHSVPVELGDLEGGRSGTAGRRQSRQRARWKQLIASGANSGTFVLMAVYVMLSGVRWFRAL